MSHQPHTRGDRARARREPVPLAWGVTINDLRALHALARRAPGWTPQERGLLERLDRILGRT